MLRMVLLLTVACAGEIIQSNRMDKMHEAAGDFGDAMQDIRREKEDQRREDAREHREAQRDSMQRKSDSLAIVIQRMELEAKRRKLESEYWQYVRDSVEAARSMRSPKEEPPTK